MNKQKFERYFILFALGCLFYISVGITKYDTLRAADPNKISKNNLLEKEIRKIENDFSKGIIDAKTYDSLITSCYSSMYNSEEVSKFPKWLEKINFSTPENLELVNYLTKFTSVKNKSEGFNSAEIVFKGDYSKSKEYLNNLVEKYNLALSPYLAKKDILKDSTFTFSNYKLKGFEGKYLISAQLIPTGKLTVMITDFEHLTLRCSNKKAKKHKNVDNIL